MAMNSWNTSRSIHLISTRTAYLILFINVLLSKSTSKAFRTTMLYRRTSTTTSSSYRQSALRMVLTTPESIIEQASTENLLDDLINESVRTSARRTIMMPFSPNSAFLWKRWRGTIFSETWGSCVTKMAYALLVFMICKRIPKITEYLAGLGTLWGQLLSITTFTLTFFVNQSYSLWRKCYDLSRRLQGRLQDIDMSLAAHAARRPATNPSEPSSYTPGARQLLELIARYVRLFNLLTYASFTRSHRPILTPRGMRRLVERGLMTAQEREVLVDLALPATQRHHAVLLWIFRSVIEGREAGHFLGGAGFEEQVIEKFHVTRQQYGGISDELHGRMPLAYSHIVQVLVDVILYMYPFMAYTANMSPVVSVIGMGLLTISYQGLCDLAKQFLDPYDNESYGKGEDPLVVDTLIAETNGASVRWLYGLDQMPVPSEKIRKGNLTDFLLPLRGYSVDEFKVMEEERLKREMELKKLRALEKAERKAAQAMVGGLIESPVAALPLASHITVKMDASLPSSLNSTEFTVDDASQVIACVDTVASMAPNMVKPIVPKGTAISKAALTAAMPFTGNAAQPEAPPGKVSKGTDEVEVDGSSLPIGELSDDESSMDFDELPIIEALPIELIADDYEQEQVDLLKEMLETEAILNAPPAADFVKIPGQPEVEDQLAVLEMDDFSEDEKETKPDSPVQNEIAFEVANGEPTSGELGAKE